MENEEIKNIYYDSIKLSTDTHNITRCPYCDATIEDYVASNDGTIALEDIFTTQTEAWIESNILQLDYSMFPNDQLYVYKDVIYCPICKGRSWYIDVSVTSRSVHNSPDGEFLMYTDWPDCKTTLLYHADGRPWMILRFEDAQIPDDPDRSPVRLDRHIIGPLPDLPSFLFLKIGMEVSRSAFEIINRNF